MRRCIRIEEIRMTNEVKVILTDVDDTVAQAFCDISKEMVIALEQLLERGMTLIFISGQSFQNIYSRVIGYLSEQSCGQIMVCPCNGAEIYRYSGNKGWVKDYSILDENVREEELAAVADFILERFNLRGISAGTMEEFLKESSKSPNEVMVGNRKVQIALDFVNGINIKQFHLPFDAYIGISEETDIRDIIVQEANQYAEKCGYQIVACIAGKYAIDLVFKGVNKGLPIRKKVRFDRNFSGRTEGEIVLQSSKEIEIWGDSFENESGDFEMSRALPPDVRTIAFRKISDQVKSTGCNIVEWDGQYSCNLGLLEYLEKSNKQASKG